MAKLCPFFQKPPVFRGDDVLLCIGDACELWSETDNRCALHCIGELWYTVRNRLKDILKLLTDGPQ